MKELTDDDIRPSFVNCSRSEAQAMTVPRDLAVVPWEDREFLGWRDPRAPLRGYVVLERDGGVLGIALRAADSRMSSGTAAMCLLCQTAQPGDAISLFTARRTGESGRNGNTVGTYICADLGCARRARTEIPQWLRERDPDEVAEERTAELHRRVHGFLDSVLGS